MFTRRQRTLPRARGRAILTIGDCWTWTALDADHKLILSWKVGSRDAEYALALMDDLRGRLANRVQLTTDGHRAYLQAVEDAFGADIDYAMLVKLYGVSSCSRPGKQRCLLYSSVRLRWKRGKSKITG